MTDETWQHKLDRVTSLALLIMIFVGLLLCTMMIVSVTATNFHLSFYLRSESILPIFLLTILVSSAFPAARFSFGFFVGFYMFAMMASYFWFNSFGTLGYDRRAALISATASIILFLLPALFLTAPAKPRFVLPWAVIDAFPFAVIAFAIVLLLATASSNVPSFGNLADMYKYRNEVNHSRLVSYAIGNFNGGLLPFAFACLFLRRRFLLLLPLCTVAVLFYAVTYTKLSLLVSFYLIFMAVLASAFNARATVILSLLIPLGTGLLSSLYDSAFTNAVFGTLSFRLLAVPGITLDHYYVFFSDHPLTHFCQISLLRAFTQCPYSDQLGVVLANWFAIGNMNASLFATEGIASIGPRFAPISALICGLVIAAGNAVTAGLPKRFVLISAAMIPQILLNVPLTTTLLSNGLGLLFVLWYFMPRDYFETARHPRLAPDSANPLEPPLAIDHRFATPLDATVMRCVNSVELRLCRPTSYLIGLTRCRSTTCNKPKQATLHRPVLFPDMRI